MRNPRLIVVLTLSFLLVAPRLRAQTTQPGRMFYGVAVGASTNGLLVVDGSNVTGLMLAASLGRRLGRGIGLQLDAFGGQVGLTVDQGFPTQGLRAADSLSSVTRAASVAGLTASGRLRLLSLPDPLLPSRTGAAGSEIYVITGAGAYYFSEHPPGNRSTRLGLSLGLGAAAPLRAFGPSLFVEVRGHALDRAHEFTWLSVGIRS